MTDDTENLTEKVAALEEELDELRQMVEALQAANLRGTWKFTFPKDALDEVSGRTLGLPMIWPLRDHDDFSFDDIDDDPDTDD
jgi:hypothetical protein